MKRLRALHVPTLLALTAALGCSVGEGEGRIVSERLHIKDCWTGPLDLVPDFFAADPYREETLQIRIQRGDTNEDKTDGMLVLIRDLQSVRAQVGEPIEVGLPAGVAPPGTSPAAKPNEKPAAAKVSLSLYMNDTCHGLNATVHSLSGNITFASLFSGDPNEENGEERLTKADFTADFADPREVLEVDDPSTIISTIRGSFSFYFQRGQPAQPFQ